MQKASALVFDDEVVSAAMVAWLPRLAPLVEAMSRRIDARTIELTAAAFIVARSFPRRSLDSRASDFLPVVALLSDTVDGLTDTNLVERVDALADAISATPGLVRQRGERPVRPISAASKLVWTARPSIGIIFDARARNCLMFAGLLQRSGGYGAYVQAVRSEMPKHTETIARLAKHAGPQLADAPWLPGKIFDFCLYAHAGEIAA
ncbi:hypothetical protein [Methylobacterium sp. NEAU K]|uniref:hypothetical protein n=1 Tax=Methylobacterium sp. NEAU K TaxID=3064946 RepID=UPI002734916F|nr:hypothetical protein [Methylobacterium sp. NEAU K]MDP4005056.1 hypothetical protein [Methylobacterium sp. NEAU K]